MLSFSCAAFTAVPAERPSNVLFILGDNLVWADIGYHDSDVRTPHLDRLRERLEEIAREDG